MLLKNEPNEMLILIKELQKNLQHVVLYGASNAGKNYAIILRTYNIPIDYFIDDDLKKQGMNCCGIEVVSLDKFIENRVGNEIILIASYSPSVIACKLEEKYSFLCKNIKWSDFYLWENELDYLKYYRGNMDQIERVMNLLCDEKSKLVFENLLNYKISRKRQLIEKIQDSVEEQYFTSEIMRFTDKEVYIDLGAYIGDTVDGFSRAVDGKFEKIIAVEPDEVSFQKLKDNTGELDEIEYYQVGIAEKDGIARFKAQALYTSHFDEEGKQEVSTRTVDSIMEGRKVTFIKADIEGLEMEMLRGAEETIKTYKPKMAIAVYHKKDDIFNIPLLIHSYRADYKFYMRHYTEMPIDTVLYAV